MRTRGPQLSWWGFISKCGFCTVIDLWTACQKEETVTATSYWFTFSLEKAYFSTFQLLTYGRDGARVNGVRQGCESRVESRARAEGQMALAFLVGSGAACQTSRSAHGSTAWATKTRRGLRVRGG